MTAKILLAAAAAVSVSFSANATPYNILWWDSTPTYGGQAADSLREDMSDYLTAYDGGTLFSSTYVSSETPGTLATHLASNSYDVIVFDATSQSLKFNNSDLDAVKAHYSAGNKNLMFDGNLYIRNINFSADTVFPGPNGAIGGLMVNQVFALADAGGGILVGTDHNCCQADANQIVNALLPGASFSGITSPTTDGAFYGDLLLNGPEAIAAADVLQHWSAVPSQAIAPTGMFNDFLGDSVKLSSLVDVASTIGGPRDSYVSTSLAVTGGTTNVDDTTAGGTGGGGGGGGGTGVIPLPMPAALLLTGLFGLAGLRVRRNA